MFGVKMGLKVLYPDNFYQSYIYVLFCKFSRKYKPEELMVRCGEWDIAETEGERYVHQDRTAKSISIHPLYTRGKSDNLKLYYDVGLVHTTEAFEFQPNVNTICLPDSVTEDNFRYINEIWGQGALLGARGPLGARGS